ncbi:MAG: hypothetical protein GX031_00790 [Candidatus Riflebacteria bacterium]|jgi:hypothetical protein|nr:hypothetical protein [Candidatus Riflebacteria bacterium]
MVSCGFLVTSRPALEAGLQRSCGSLRLIASAASFGSHDRRTFVTRILARDEGALPSWQVVRSQWPHSRDAMAFAQTFAFVSPSRAPGLLSVSRVFVGVNKAPAFSGHYLSGVWDLLSGVVG